MKIYNNFHSNYLEDQWIANNLQLPEKGVFVDVGACDAINRSNTYHFEMNGWTGLCIEPDKFYFSDGKDSEGPNNPLPKFGAYPVFPPGEINFVEPVSLFHFNI